MTIAQNTLEAMNDVMADKKTVRFVMNKQIHELELKAPTIKQVDAVRKKHIEYLQEQRQKAKSSGQKPLDFQVMVNHEMQAASWLKICLPQQFKNKSVQQIMRFIRGLDGGIFSPLVVQAQKMCGVMVGYNPSPHTLFDGPQRDGNVAGVDGDARKSDL